MSASLDLTYRPSRASASVADWIRRTAASGAQITALHAESWAAAIEAAAAKQRQIEDLFISRDLDLKDRVDARFAALIVEEGTRAVRELAEMAAEAATRNELKVIDAAACGLISALEALAAGVRRRAEAAPKTLTQMTQTDEGA